MIQLFTLNYYTHRPIGETDYGKKFKDDRYKGFDPRLPSMRETSNEEIDEFLGNFVIFWCQLFLDCTFDPYKVIEKVHTSQNWLLIKIPQFLPYPHEAWSD